jgi:hypothetical protein
LAGALFAGYFALKDAAATRLIRDAMRSSFDFSTHVEPVLVKSPLRLFVPSATLSHPEAPMEILKSDVRLSFAEFGQVHATIQPEIVRIHSKRLQRQWAFIKPILKIEISRTGTQLKLENWTSGDIHLEGTAHSAPGAGWDFMDLHGSVEMAMIQGLMPLPSNESDEPVEAKGFRILYENETATLWIDDKIAFRAKWKMRR